MNLPVKVYTGCCGWSYLNVREFERELAGAYSSKLQAYARLFGAVEINSSFYRLPRVSTAEKWRKEADEINPGFEFTVKAFKGITHLHRFQKQESLEAFGVIREICSALRAQYVLFQSPAGFKPNDTNIENMNMFFEKADTTGLIPVWEPRGSWYDNPDLIERVCRENNLVHCVDPFRNDPLTFGKTGTAYLRLHGFGSPTMYNYNFSDEEIRRLREKIGSFPAAVRQVYVFFNNEACYRNGLMFQGV